MNKKTSTLWSGVSLLIVAVLAVTAFSRGNIQIWLLTGIFSIWGIWATIKFLLPFMKNHKDRAKIQTIKKKGKSEKSTHDFEIPDVSDPINAVLLRHVNYRISAYLRAMFPKVVWEWCDELPERTITDGGTARIKLYGVPDFNYADVTFDWNANIDFAFLKIVPMAEINSSPEETEIIPQRKQPIDPQIWYEKHARTVLEDIISDLNSRGHDSLTICENGDIVINQSNSEVSLGALDNVPAKVYWPRLSDIFARERLAADVTDDGIVLSW